MSYVKQKITFLSGIVATLTSTDKFPARLSFLNPNVLKSQFRGLFNRYFSKKGGIGISSEATIENKLMFVFQGRNGNYTRVGQALYKDNHVFHDSINKCHNVCNKKFNFNLLRIFEDENFDLKDAPELEIFISLSCIQCALTDFYSSKKIVPEAIVAMSLGEAAAGYAAGAYSLEDAVSIAFYIFETCTHMAEKCTLFMLDLSLAELRNLMEESAGTLIHFAEFTSTKRVLICSNKNIDIVSEVLLKNNISSNQLQYHGAYHTPYSIEVINKARIEIMSKFGSVTYLPLKIPFHTCLYEKEYPEGSRLDSAFWVDMLTHPVLFGRVITNAIGSGFNTYLNIGAHPKLSDDIIVCANDINRKVVIFDSFSKDDPELPLIHSTVTSLSTLFGCNTLPPTPETSEYVDNPTGFMGPDFFQDPYPVYELLRKDHDIQYLQQQDYWLVLNYADVEFALKNPGIFSSSPAKGLDAVLLGAESFDHGRARKIMAPFFKNASIASLANFIQSTADRLLQNSRNTIFDIVDDYAVPLTEKVIGHLIGLQLEEFKLLQKKIGTNKYELTYIPFLEDFFLNYLKSGKDFPHDSFFAQLLNQEKEQGFTIHELTSILKLLWVAGTTTTSMLISSSVKILLSQRDLMNEVRQDFLKLPGFIEEVLRVESPEQTCWRTTMNNVKMSGIVIPENSSVRLCLGSANRDPLVFESPGEFKMIRNNRKHLAFAAGPHYCLGAELARLEARIAIQTLVKTFPALRLKATHHEIEYLHSDHFRAIKHLMVAME